MDADPRAFFLVPCLNKNYIKFDFLRRYCGGVRLRQYGIFTHHEESRRSIEGRLQNTFDEYLPLCRRADSVGDFAYPTHFFEPVADKLLVERIWNLSQLKILRRPKTRTVGRENFIDENQSSV